MTEELIKIKYHFPLIGNINIVLKGLSYKFYKILEKRGEINRLKELKHLGVLNQFFPGIKHTRYDYTILNLYLAQKLNLPETKDRKIGDLKVSKREFMDLLILSANIGHIYGTFAVEKALYFYILEQNLLDEILKFIDDSGIKELKKKIKNWLRKQDYRAFNKLLALVKLSSWINIFKDNDNKKLLEAIKIIIGMFLFEEEWREYQATLFKKYNFLRKISYLFLDSMYIDSPLKINFSEIFKIIQNDFKNVLNDVETLKLVYQYEQIVYEKLYHHNNIRTLVGFICKNIPKPIRNFHDKKIINIILDWLKESEIEEVYEEIKNIKLKDYINTCHISLSGSSAFFLREERLLKGIMKVERDLKKKIKTECVIPSLLITDDSPEEISWEIPGQIWIDIFSYCKLERKNYIEIITKISDFIYSLDLYFGSTKIFEQLIQQLLIHSIEKENIDVQLKIHPNEFFENIGEKIIAFRNLRTKKDDVMKEIKGCFLQEENSGWNKSKKEKFHEHMALWNLIKLLRRRLYKGKSRLTNRLFFILPCSIIINDKKTNKNLVEFDGGVLEMRVRSGKAIMYLLEAKRRGSRNKAIRELKKKFERLGIQLNNEDFNRLRKSDGWVTWRLN